MMPTLSIFVSSPGDVAQERALAEGVIERLQGEFASRVRLEPIFWEHEPLLATDSFQDQIVRPSETDITVCILWSRLGTRLPDRFRRPDGSRYASGTEFEFEDAVEGWRSGGRPDLLVYRKTAEPLVSLLDPDALMEKLRQRQALDAFVQRWFHDQADGSLRAAYHQFPTPEDFEATLERHLRRLIDRRAPPAPVATADRPVDARWTEGSPFRGLEPFDEEHAEVFFGRTRAISEVLDHLRAQDSRGRPFVVVVGMSGGGKSSLVRAGLLPLLTRPGVVEGVPHWRRAVLRPADQGGDPILSLAAALTSPGALPELVEAGTSVDELATLLRTAPTAVGSVIRPGLDRAGEGARLVVVVDQLEELFTLKGLSVSERRAFGKAVEALVKSGRVWVIATLRSDLYPRLAEVPELVALKEGQGQYDLLAPSVSEITQMIRQPVGAAGLRLDVAPDGERLEDRLVDAAAGRPGSLPLLEFTLEQLYRLKTPEGLLTLAAFDELGGVEGSLARRAEEVFTSLPGTVRDALPGVMRQLVTVVENAEGTAVAARPATLERLRDAPESSRLVDALVDARLLVTDWADEGGAVVRVAHEALLRHWPRLNEWLEADREVLKSRARLRAAAFRWAESARNPDLLLTKGKPLEDARSVVTSGANLTTLEQDFVAASNRKARRFVVLRRLAFAALSVLTIAAATSGWAARRAAVLAESQAHQVTRTHEFMVGLLSLAQPSLSQGRETTVKDLLDAGRMRLLAGELSDVPATGAWAMRDLSGSYVSLGELESALELARAADSLAAKDAAVPDSVRALGWTLLGEIHQQRGDLDSAVVHYDRAIDVWTRVSPPMLSNALTGLATVRRDQGRHDEFETLMDSASASGLAHTDSTTLDYAVILSNEALRQMARGEGAGAESLLRRAERIWATHPGERLSDYAVLLAHLARARALQGDLVAADSLFQEGLAIERRILPEGHPTIAVTLNNIALNAQELGDTVAAEGWLREAIQVARGSLGPDHPRTAAAMINLGELLSHRPSTYAEADTLLIRALEGLARTAPANADVSIALQNRGALLRAWGRGDSAVVLFEEAFRADSVAGRHLDAVFVAARGADVANGAADSLRFRRAVARVFASADRITDRRARADVLDEVQDLLFNSSLFTASERAAQASLELRESLDPSGSADVANSLADMAWWDAVLGARDSLPDRAERAETRLARAEALLDSIPPEDQDWLAAHQALTFALSALDRDERVVEREAEAARRLRDLGRAADAVNALLRQGLALEELGRIDDAVAAYDEAAAWVAELLGPGHPLATVAGERSRGVRGGTP